MRFHRSKLGEDYLHHDFIVAFQHSDNSVVNTVIEPKALWLVVEYKSNFFSVQNCVIFEQEMYVPNIKIGENISVHFCLLANCQRTITRARRVYRITTSYWLQSIAINSTAGKNRVAIVRAGCFEFIGLQQHILF